MATRLERALRMAINLRQPKAGLILHTDQGAQYTSHSFQNVLAQEKIIPSMSGKGACWYSGRKIFWPPKKRMVAWRKLSEPRRHNLLG